VLRAAFAFFYGQYEKFPVCINLKMRYHARGYVPVDASLRLVAVTFADSLLGCHLGLILLIGTDFLATSWPSFPLSQSGDVLPLA